MLTAADTAKGGGGREAVASYRFRGMRINSKMWVLEWSDGAETFVISGEFDLLCDLAHALRLMMGGEVQSLWLDQFPMPIDEDERGKVIAKLRRTRARMRAPHVTGETVNRYWRSLVSQTGCEVEFPYV
jgi:hypothetical protein